MLNLLPLPHGAHHINFEAAVSAYHSHPLPQFPNQKSYAANVPLSPHYAKFRCFDNKIISHIPVWVIAQGLHVVSMGIEEFSIKDIGTAGDHAYIIECVLNDHLNTEQPISSVNKHQPQLEFVKVRSKDNRHGSIQSLTTIITYLPASNCFYTAFAPMPYPGTGYVPLPAEC